MVARVGMGVPVPSEVIARKIFIIRGMKVMIDRDLAGLYGVTTMALNQAVKRNEERFPADFVFRLTKTERDEVITVCDNLQPLKFSPVLPNAFTENGVAMLSSVLKSKLVSPPMKSRRAIGFRP